MSKQNYLNYEGLSDFWERSREYIDKVADWVGTQAEYDAAAASLPNGKIICIENKGVYVKHNDKLVLIANNGSSGGGSSDFDELYHKPELTENVDEWSKDTTYNFADIVFFQSSDSDKKYFICCSLTPLVGDVTPLEDNDNWEQITLIDNIKAFEFNYRIDENNNIKHGYIDKFNYDQDTFIELKPIKDTTLADFDKTLSDAVEGDLIIVQDQDFGTDYNILENKPSINGVELKGNKTTEELGITGGGCNTNLLKNPWFNVNSRNKEDYEATDTLTVDKWYTGKIIDGASEKWIIWQYLNELEPNTYTFSALINNTSSNNIEVTIKFKNNNDDLLSSEDIMVPPTEGVYVLLNQTFEIEDYITKIEMIIPSIAPDVVEFKAVKLEIGSSSSLSQEIAPVMEEERLKCQISSTDNNDVFSNKNVVMSEGWQKGSIYNKDEYAIHNNILWKSKINNNKTEPEYNDYWVMANINEVLNDNITNLVKLTQQFNTEISELRTEIDTEISGLRTEVETDLGGLKFGIDGDGNYGYYKADGSFDPFKRTPFVTPVNQIYLNYIKPGIDGPANNLQKNYPVEFQQVTYTTPLNIPLLTTNNKLSLQIESNNLVGKVINETGTVLITLNFKFATVSPDTIYVSYFYITANDILIYYHRKIASTGLFAAPIGRIIKIVKGSPYGALGSALTVGYAESTTYTDRQSYTRSAFCKNSILNIGHRYATNGSGPSTYYRSTIKCNLMTATASAMAKLSTSVGNICTGTSAYSLAIWDKPKNTTLGKACICRYTSAGAQTLYNIIETEQGTQAFNLTYTNRAQDSYIGILQSSGEAIGFTGQITLTGGALIRLEKKNLSYYNAANYIVNSIYETLSIPLSILEKYGINIRETETLDVDFLINDIILINTVNNKVILIKIAPGHQSSEIMIVKNSIPLVSNSIFYSSLSNNNTYYNKDFSNVYDGAYGYGRQELKNCFMLERGKDFTSTIEN